MKPQGCYVYLYRDPKTDNIFYVGRGTNYRYKSHLKPSLWKSPKETHNPFLYYKIRSLMENDVKPKIEIVCDNMTESECNNLENFLISLYGRRKIISEQEDGCLFNIAPDNQYSHLIGVRHEWSDDRRKHHQQIHKARRKYDPTYEELYDDFIIKNKPRRQIAEENGVSDVLVKKRLQSFGITKPKILLRRRVEHTCKHCGSKFEKPQSVKVPLYCSKYCRIDSEKQQKIQSKCLRCGTLFTYPSSSPRAGKYCSRKCIKGSRL